MGLGILFVPLFLSRLESRLGVFDGASFIQDAQTYLDPLFLGILHAAYGHHWFVR